MNFQILEQIFTDYVNTFDRTNKKINLKYSHTLRVSSISEHLAKELGLNNEDIELARLIGLLHDIARFYEITAFDGFDNREFDHAGFGAKMLFEDGMIKDYLEDEINYDIIKSAIYYHNKYALPNDLNERTKLFCKIIRDADKIDIYYVYYKKLVNLFKTKPSDQAVKTFFEHKSLSFNDAEKGNHSDATLMVIAMIFDINFKESFKYMLDNNTIDHYLGSIIVSDENKELFDKILEDVNNYVRKKI